MLLSYSLSFVPSWLAIHISCSCDRLSRIRNRSTSPEKRPRIAKFNNNPRQRFRWLAYGRWDSYTVSRSCPRRLTSVRVKCFVICVSVSVCVCVTSLETKQTMKWAEWCFLFQTYLPRGKTNKNKRSESQNCRSNVTLLRYQSCRHRKSFSLYILPPSFFKDWNLRRHVCRCQFNPHELGVWLGDTTTE